ncbi:hypothetical protein ACNO8S_16405 (plasmid) [Haloarcula sp. KBTZ06]|uniref:hypothetical protein n=1 Tax=Haloarcula sp. KBTZ06 TaxID=3402682 RepID=UPI003B43ADCF
MVDRKNIKVSETTHQRIKHEQQDGETMDDTLQRVLGIASDPEDMESTVAAYMPNHMRNAVDELADYIETLGDFEREYNPDGGQRGSDAIAFRSRSSGIVIAQIECRKAQFTVCYRDATEEMSPTGAGVVTEQMSIDMDEWKSDIKRRVSGAVRRWGTA